jgi:polyphosphate glucokinase
MALSSAHADDLLFAIDVGATNVKFCHVDRSGNLVEAVRKSSTPYPCSPERLVEVLSVRIQRSVSNEVGVGFPGEFAQGLVIDPGNLARPGGIGTEVDPSLNRRWQGFAFEEKLARLTGRDVRVRNDADLAALGCCRGVGVEMVLTLGTGFGLAVMVDGNAQKVRDVGVESFQGVGTYDDVLGERSRAEDEERWRAWCSLAVMNFAREFHATTVYLAGGNARRLSPHSFPDLTGAVMIAGNEASLRGVAKLF